MQGEDFVGRAEELDALKGFLADDAQVLAESRGVVEVEG